jgi:putative endonuclease
MTTQHTGQAAERLAKAYLEQQGLVCHATNYHCRHGEIDLVMQQQAYLVFVEVRYRQQQHYGGAIHSLSAIKQQRLRHTAQHYLQHTCQAQPWPACRFDLVAFSTSICTRELVWLRNILQS